MGICCSGSGMFKGRKSYFTTNALSELFVKNDVTGVSTCCDDSNKPGQVMGRYNHSAFIDSGRGIFNSDWGGTSKDPIVVNNITLDNVMYYYLGTLENGVTVLYSDHILETPAASLSGNADDLDGDGFNDEWSTDGDGVLTWIPGN